MMRRISKSGKILMIVLLAALFVAGIAVCTTTALVSGETPGTAFADTQIIVGSPEYNTISTYYNFTALAKMSPYSANGNAKLPNDIYLYSNGGQGRKINNLSPSDTDHYAYGPYALENKITKQKYVFYKWSLEAFWCLGIKYLDEYQLQCSMSNPNVVTPQPVVYVWDFSSGFPLSKDASGNVYFSFGDGVKFYISPSGVSKDTPNSNDKFDFTQKVDSLAEALLTLGDFSTTYTGEAVASPAISALASYHITFESSISDIIKTDVGTYNIFVKPADGYCWQNGGTEYRQVKWQIKPADFANVKVTASDISVIGLDDINAQPGVSVTLNGKNLPAGDYKLEYADNTQLGRATVTVTPQGSNVTGSPKTAQFDISLDLAKANPTIELAQGEDLTFDGLMKQPEITVKIGETELDKDYYKVSYSDNQNAGEATVKITGVAPYCTGEATKTFTIAPASMDSVTATLKNDGKLAYTGQIIELSADSFQELYIGAYELTDGDFEIAYSPETVKEPGHYTATLKGKGSNFDESTSKVVEFDIVLDLNGATIELDKNADYTYAIGKEHKPEITAITLADGVTKLDGDTLTKFLEKYDVTYANNTGAGEASVTISPKAEGGDSTHYIGTANGSFTINKKELKEENVTIENKDSITYDGSEQKPVKITDGETDVTDQFDITYENNTNAGTANYTATAKEESSYSGEITGEFEIKKAQWDTERLKSGIKPTPEKLGTTASNSVKFKLPEGVTLSLAEGAAEYYTYDSATATLSLNEIPEAGINIGEPVEFTIAVESDNFTLAQDADTSYTVAWEFTEGFLVTDGSTKTVYPTLAAALKAANSASDSDVTIEIKTGEGGLTHALTADFESVTLDGGKNITVKAAEGSNAIVKVQATDVTEPYITLGSGTLTFEGVTLEGTDGSEGNCSATFASVTGESATLTFTDSTVSGFAGALTASAGNITASGTTFSGNKAANGGAIKATGASVTLTDCTFTGNTATAGEANTGLGGAIYIDNTAAEGKALTVTSGTFTENSAEQGGAIYFAGAGATAQLVIGEGSGSMPALESNLAEQNGGAIYAASGTMEVKAAAVSNNSAKSGIGDGIYLAGTMTAAENSSANLTFNANSADTDGFKDGIGVDGLSTITVSGDITSRASKLTVEFGDELIKAAGDEGNANHSTVAGHKFVTSGEGGATENELKAQFRVANPGYTFDPKNEEGGFLAVKSTGDMFVYVQTSAGTYQGFNSIEQALEAIKSGTFDDNALYFTVNITYTDSAITNVTFEQETDRTLTIPADSDVTLKTLVRVANRTGSGDLEYFTDADAASKSELTTALNTALNSYFSAEGVVKPEWYDQSKSSVGEPTTWDFVVKRGEGFNGELLKVEQGATATINDVIFDGGAVWESGHPAISDNGNKGAGTVTTNNAGLTAHAPAIVNQGMLTLGEGCVVRNNDNNYAMPGDGFGSQYYGGGVRNEGKGQLTVDGATIADNYAREGGGILNINKEGTDGYFEGGSPTVTVKSGTIQYNASQMKGAAAQTIYGGATTTVEGGKIENNFSLYDLGTLSVEEGGTLRVTGGEISAGTVAVGGDNESNNGGQGGTQNAYAIYVYNAYSEDDVASADESTRPYIEGKAAAKLSVSGAPTLGMGGSATADKGGAIFLDKDVDVYNSDKHFAPNAELSGYNGTGLDIVVSAEHGFTDGKPVVTGDKSGKASVAFDGEVPSDPNSKKFFINEDGSVTVGGYELTYAQTTPGEITIFGAITPGLSLELECGGSSVTLTGDERGEINQNNTLALDANDGEAGKFTLNGTLTASAGQDIQGDNNVEGLEVYVLFFDPTTADISGVTDGGMQTYYKDKDGNFKQLTDGVLPNDIAIDGDGNATFHIGTNADEAADERVIKLGMRETTPEPAKPTVTDLAGSGKEGSFTYSFEIEGKDGLEYALTDESGDLIENGGKLWHSPADGRVTFDGLSASTKYGVSARAKAGEGTIPGEYATYNDDLVTTLTEAVAKAKAAFEAAYDAATASGAKSEDIRAALDSYDTLDKADDTKAATSLKHIEDKRQALEGALVENWAGIAAELMGQDPATIAEAEALIGRIDEALAENDELAKLNKSETEKDTYFVKQTAQDVEALRQLRKDVVDKAKSIAKDELSQKKAEFEQKFEGRISGLDEAKKAAARAKYGAAMQAAWSGAVSDVNGSVFPDKEAEGTDKTATTKAVEQGKTALERAHALAALEEHYDEIADSFASNGIDPAVNGVIDEYNAQKEALAAFDPAAEAPKTFEQALEEAILALDKAEAKDILDAYLNDADSEATRAIVDNAETGAKAAIDKLTSAEDIDSKVEQTKLEIEKNRAKEAVQDYYDSLKEEFKPAEGDSAFDKDNALFDKYVKDGADNPIEKQTSIEDVLDEQKRIEAALDLEAEKDRLAATVEATDPNKDGKLAAADKVLDDAVKAMDDGTTPSAELEQAVKQAKDAAKAELDGYDAKKFEQDHKTLLDKYSDTLENVTKDDLDDINAALNDMQDGYTVASQDSEGMDALRDKLLEMKKKATNDYIDDLAGDSDAAKAWAEQLKNAVGSLTVEGDAQHDAAVDKSLDDIKEQAPAQIEQKKFYEDDPSVAPGKSVDDVTYEELEDIKKAESDFDKLSPEAKELLDADAQGENYADFKDKLNDFRAKAELEDFKNKHPHIFGQAFAELPLKDKQEALESALAELNERREQLGGNAQLLEKFEEMLDAAAGEGYDDFDSQLNDYSAQAELEKFKEEHPVVKKQSGELTGGDKQAIEDAIAALDALKKQLTDDGKTDVLAKLEEKLNGEAKAENSAYADYEEKLDDMRNRALFEEYKAQLKSELDALAEQEGNGDYVKQALAEAKQLLDDVAYATPATLPTTELDAANKTALDDAAAKGRDLIKHAGDKDEIVSALNADVQSKKDSGEYSSAQLEALEGIVDGAKAEMDAITGDFAPKAGEQGELDKAKTKLDAVKDSAFGKLGDSPKTHATTDGIDVQGNVEDGAQENAEGLLGIVTNDSGINGGVTLHVDEVDPAAQREIESAISGGKLEAASGTTMTADEMKQAVSGKQICLTLDIYLLKNNARVEEFSGIYKIKLLLSDELKQQSGMQVVYFNSATGMLEVFATTLTKDGDKTYLEFSTTHFSDFYIISEHKDAEPTLNLWWLIILLSIILLLECIVIVLIAVRKKDKKDNEPDSEDEQMDKDNNNDNKSQKAGKRGGVKTYVSLLPALLLGVVVIPSPAIAVCVTLGVLIVVAAAVIVAMLLSRSKSKKQPAAEPAPTDETLLSKTYVSETITESTTVKETAVEQELASSEEPKEAVEEPEEQQPEEEQPQEKPAEAQQSADETATDDGDISYLTDFEETGETSGRAYDARRRLFVLVRYDRSYTSRLIQADDKTKSYYDEIKGELMSYNGVKSRISWRHENFRIGRERVAKLQFRGKKLCLYLPLDPNDYIDSKYKIEDFSDVIKNQEVPLAYLIKNDLRARYAKELIAVVMARFGAKKTEGEPATYSQDYPFDTLDSLINRKLIKVLMTEQELEEAAADRATAATAPKEQPAKDSAPAAPLEQSELVHEVKAESVKKMISDERASKLIEEGVRFADRTRTGYVNIDVLSRCFEAGEYVTLEEMKNRITGFDKRMTFVKVLARGVLDKPLTVEGDDFSIDAAKMILLTGGKVIRTRRK